MRSIGRIDSGNFSQATAVKNVDFSRKIAKTCEKDKTSLRIKRNKVMRRRTEVMQFMDPLIKDHRFGRHI